jgi:hypothetical protein
MPHEKAGPEKDACQKAIEALVADASPEAVTALKDFLTRDDMDRKMRIEAAVALGRIGTAEAVKAIGEFEDWAEKRRTDPVAWEFGMQDFPIDHFNSQKIEPLAQWKLNDGTERAVFLWYRFGQQMIYVTHRKDGADWVRPVLLNTPPDTKRFLGLPKLDAIKAEGDIVQLRLEAEGRMRVDLKMVAPDADKDGIPDRIEKILGTDPEKPDTDGDGINDGADGNPMTPKAGMNDDAAQIRQAVFTTLFATSNSRDMIVVVENAKEVGKLEILTNDVEDAGNPEPPAFARQEYRGFAGHIVRAPRTREGFVNITKFDVKLDSPTEATVNITDWEGGLAASGHEAKLKKLHGKWVVVKFGMTWIS